MTVLASFNYMHSSAAVWTGGICACVWAAVLIWIGRPWIAAAAGAVGWAILGYLVGRAGTGDMTELTALVYAVLGAPAGALIAGGGALFRRLSKRRTIRGGGATDGDGRRR